MSGLRGWVVVLMVAVVASVLNGCAAESAPAKKGETTQTPLVIVPASKDTKSTTKIVSWRVFPYQKGTTSGFTIMGLDANKKMVRAARVFKVPGAVKGAATTLAFAPLFPKVKGRIRMLDNGLIDETSLGAKDFNKYFRRLRSDLATYLQDSHSKSTDTNGQRVLTCLKAPSQKVGLFRHQTRLCGLAIHAFYAKTSSKASLKTKTLHIMDDEEGGGGGEETTPDPQPEQTPDPQPETQPDPQPEQTPDAQPEQTPEGDNTVDTTPATQPEGNGTENPETTENPAPETEPAPTEPEANVPSGVEPEATRTADNPSEPLPTESTPAAGATTTEGGAATTADASNLGASTNTAQCADCASTVAAQTSEAQVLAETRAPDYYQVTLSVSALGVNAQVSIAVTNTGNIYASAGGEINSGTNVLPAFSGSATANWMLSGNVDEFLPGATNSVSATGGVVNVTYAQNASGVSLGVGPAVGEGVSTGVSYGVNLTEMANNYQGSGVYSPYGNDANGQPISLPYP